MGPRRFVRIGLVVAWFAYPVIATTQRSGQLQPDVTGDTDGRHAWMTAVYRDLIVRKLVNPAKGSLSIDLRHELDVVTISADAAGQLKVSRGPRKVLVSSAESLAEARQMLRGSDGVSQLLALERRSVRLRAAPEVALLSTIAFVGSLAGDEGAPGRLHDRAVNDPLWFKPAPSDRCAPEYAVRSSEAWDLAHACLGDDHASGDGLLACRLKWFLQAEAAWFTYLNCVSPVVRP